MFFSRSRNQPNFMMDPILGSKVKDMLGQRVNHISDESLIKVTRQLEFWYAEKTLSHDDFLNLVNELIHTTTWFHRIFPVDPSDSLETSTSTVSWLKQRSTFQVPKVRFGRTELQMPIITCGAMRFQQTWLPDFVPYLSPKRADVLKGPSQENIKDIVRNCLALGLNHFETARFYGTSEYQLVDALHELIQSGEVKREDFIFQTKVGPAKTREEFEKSFMQSWNNIGEKLGYIDLLAIHGLGNPSDIQLMDSDNSYYDAIVQYKAENKVRFIGFSTHGSAELIMKLISSNKFDYVNLHCHFFGSYHAEGTPDSMGGYGNVACVKKALELDMGLFCISPFDKGGKLYQPSKRVATAIGPKLSPIAFTALYDWKVLGFHTISVGFARPSDLDEVIRAAEVYLNTESHELTDAVNRLTKLKLEKLGSDWIQKEYENIPTFWEKSSGGVAIAHLLWLHDLLSAYGMYHFCKERYDSCTATTKKWNKTKDIDDNSKAIMGYAFNPGTNLRPDVDLMVALKSRSDAESIMKKLSEVNVWLSGAMSDQELRERGWQPAYSLSTWTEYPGAPILSGILLQNLTCGVLGSGGGKESKFSSEARNLRNLYSGK